MIMRVGRSGQSRTEAQGSEPSGAMARRSDMRPLKAPASDAPRTAMPDVVMSSS